MTNPSKTEPRISLFAMFVLGVCLGAPLILFAQFSVADNVTTFASFLVLLLIVVITNIGLVIYFRRRLWAFLGSSWNSIIDSLKNAVNEYSAGRPQGGMEHTGEALKKLVARVVWYSFIASCFVVCFALISAFGAVLNSSLMFKQNEIMKFQNEIINWQKGFTIEQEGERKKSAALANNREMRRRLDSILGDSVKGHIVAHLGATFAELLDDLFSTEMTFGGQVYDEGESQPQVILQQSDTRIFLLLMLKNQISMERAIEIICKLETADPSLLSVADYVAVSNGLFSTGQLQLAESYARKGLERNDRSLIDVFLQLHIAKIRYAKNDANSARIEFNNTISTVDEMGYSDVEKYGFKAILQAMQAHFELDAENIERAKSLMEVVKKELLPEVPVVDRGIRWRTEHLITAFEGKLRLADNAVIENRQLTDEQLSFQYFKKMNFWANEVPSLAQLDQHVRAYINVRKKQNEIELRVQQEISRVGLNDPSEGGPQSNSLVVPVPIEAIPENEQVPSPPRTSVPQRNR